MPWFRKNSTLKLFLTAILFTSQLVDSPAHAGEISKEAIWRAEIEQLVQSKGIFPIEESLPEGLSGSAFFAAVEQFFQSYDGGASQFIPNLSNFQRSFQEGVQEGIGLSLRLAQDGCCHYSVRPNTPASTAGLPAKGKLLRVDGQDVSKLSLTAMASLLTEKGSQALMIEVREAPGIPSVGKIISPGEIQKADPALGEIDGLRTLRIPHFRTETRFQVEKLIERLDDTQPLVIDLRGNSGGSSRSATRIACLFIKKDTSIFRERRRSDTRDRVCRWQVVPGLANRKVIILQDGNTASSAELFIAAMKTRNQTTTVGQQSYGKGVKASLLRLSKGAGLLLSTSEYLTVDGEKIQGTGIAPDRDWSDQSSLRDLLGSYSADPSS